MSVNQDVILLVALRFEHGLLLGEKFSGEYTIEGRVRPEGRAHVEIHGFVLTEDVPLIQVVGIVNGIAKPDGRTILKGANCYSSASGNSPDLTRWRSCG